MDLSEVRVNIDRVDKEIRKLFMERMLLADQVACIKAKTKDVIYKPDRETAIIEKQTEDVEDKFLKEYTALIKRIMEVSRKYQYGRTMELRDCFPFSFCTEDQTPKKPAMVKQELYLCDVISKDMVSVVDSYEQIGEAIKDGRADGGMGIIEEIGVGVSDELHTLLVKDQLYIKDCVIKEENGVKKKLVTFTAKLIALPEHNRVKIMFECPNREGSLSSILSMISDYGINLTEIHSRPFEREEEWNYYFFAELNANFNQAETKALLFQLSQETTYLQVLGSYYCDYEF